MLLICPSSAVLVRIGYELDIDWAHYCADEYRAFFAFVREQTDVIRGVTYINSDWDTQGQWAPPYENGYFGDSRVQANPEIRERWLAELRQEPWNAGL